MSFDDVFDGEVLRLPHRGILLSCCNCGLTHMFVLMTSYKEPVLKVYRDESTTNELRADLSLKELDRLIKELQELKRKKRGKPNTLDKEEK